MAIISPSKAGFTLIETMVVAGIMGLLSVGIVNLFLATLGGSTKAKLIAEIKSQGDFAITSMERSLRQAKAVPSAADCPGDTIKFTSNSDSKEYQYNVVQGKILKSDDGSTWSPVTGDASVSNFTITCNQPSSNGFDPGSIKVSFSLSLTERGVTETQQFSTTVAIRNN